MSESGKKKIEKIRNENSCYDVIVGKGTISQKDKAPLDFININFIACSGSLYYDSIHKSVELREQIAKELYAEYLEKQDYEGIQLTFQLKENSSLYTKTFLYTFDKNQNVRLKDSSILEFGSR
jgi:hypothetical protein